MLVKTAGTQQLDLDGDTTAETVDVADTLEITCSVSAPLPPPPAEPTATPPPTDVVREAQPTPARPAPAIGCLNRGNNHLNIELLRAQPGMAEAAITEIDEGSVGLQFEGVELIISGWGTLIGIGGPGDPTNEQLERIGLAIDAVRYEC